VQLPDSKAAIRLAVGLFQCRRPAGITRDATRVPGKSHACAGSGLRPLQALERLALNQCCELAGPAANLGVLTSVRRLTKRLQRLFADRFERLGRRFALIELGTPELANKPIDVFGQ